MKKLKLVTFIHLFLWWVITFLIVLSLIIPSTERYEKAIELADQYVIENNLRDEYQNGMFRTGMVYGIMMNRNGRFLLFTFLVQTILIIVLFFSIREFISKKPTSYLLPDPLDSIKNILSNILLFVSGIFNRRTADQLQYYFPLTVQSRIIAILAYALIFISINFVYEMQDSAYSDRFVLLTYLSPVMPVLLITVTLFIKPFRKNYQRRLFWISLVSTISLWILSSYIGYTIAVENLASKREFSSSAMIDGRSLLFILFVVLAFSFYIEIMKTTFSKQAGMASEILLAQKIQKDLIPTIHMKTKSYELYGDIESAYEIGGDYCDAITIEKDKIVLAVGDVSGHNVAAGVLMSMLKIAFRTELHYIKNPVELISSLNENLFENIQKNMFISFIFTVIDTRNKVLDLINCGHPPLLHYKKSEMKSMDYRTGDLALGVKRDTKFRKMQINYRSGDILLLFSDGLLETVNNRGEELGLDTVRGLLKENAQLSAKEVYIKIVNAAKNFRRKVPQRDDLSLMVMKLL
jgi:serine phosphatase RsbU (regulator of sigma subunit)